MAIDFNLSGVSDLVEELDRMTVNSALVIDEALKLAAEPILADARQTTAFVDRSGKLRKSLVVSKVKIKNGQKFILAGAFDADVFYARMVEFGTSKAKPHPFLMPAFERHKEKAYEIIRLKLQEALK
jgi:HK97 gp10 family phage protein